MKKNALYFLVLILLISASMLIGRYGFQSGINELKHNKLLQNLIFHVRLPRIVISLFVGAGLAVSGLVMQSIFQNPLADPGILGISQAAGFGASLGFLIKSRFNIPVQFFAFLFGILALIMVLNLSKSFRNESRIGLIFAGISISALFSAGLGIIKYLADPLDTLPSIVFWLLGSLSSTTWQTVLEVAPIALICMIVLFSLRWRLNVYSLNDAVTHSLGVNKRRELNIVLGVTVLLTTSVISVAGLVGWVGLIIPNIVRLIFGFEISKSLPMTIILGSGFVLICDSIARSAIAGEIPLGIITAFFGASTIIYVMRRNFLPA